LSPRPSPALPLPPGTTEADRTHWERVTSILAIDPGAHTGWALLLDIDGWHVAACGVVAPSDRTWRPLKRIGVVVIEDPQIYPHSKARPADILKLARIVGRYEERFADCPQQRIKPREWKGSIDGDIMVRRIEAAFTPRDRGAFDAFKGGYRDNALDAIGLAKWATRQPFMRMRAAA
jgi:hypothetical protein